jgi:hypothetical protein
MADLAPVPQQQQPDAVRAESGGISSMVQQMMQRMMQSHVGAPPGDGGQGRIQPLGGSNNGGGNQIIPQHAGKANAAPDQAMMGQQGANDIWRGVQQAIQEHKQKQLNEATAMWMTLQAAHERLTMVGKAKPDGSVNLMDDPMAKAILTDPKRMKNMAKAFQVDMMNPEKTNVYAEGLKKAMTLDKSGKMIKMLKGLIGKGPKPQIGPEQRGQMGQELGQRVEGMTGPGQVDPAKVAELARVGEEEKRTNIMAREKYDFKPGTDPKSNKPGWFAFDKTDPSKPGKRVEIEGEQIGTTQGRPSQAQMGKAVTIEGKPYGIVGQNGIVTPSDPEFQKDESIQRKYMEANKAWSAAEAAKAKLAGIRASTYINSREYGVYDNETKSLTMANPNQINGNPGRYAPAGGAMQAMTKEAVFKDIYYNADNVDAAAKNLKNGFTSQQRAQFIVAMRSTDPANSFSTFLSSSAAPKEQDQIDYLTAIASLQENAMAMRAVAGLGAGSDQLREAILRTVPGPGSPSYAMVKRQLELFRGTAKRLETAVPGLGQQTDKSDGSPIIDLSH